MYMLSHSPLPNNTNYISEITRETIMNVSGKHQCNNVNKLNIIDLVTPQLKIKIIYLEKIEKYEKEE